MVSTNEAAATNEISQKPGFGELPTKTDKAVLFQLPDPKSLKADPDIDLDSSIVDTRQW